MGVGLLRNHPIALSRLPEYTYTGSHQLIDDGGGNWRIRLLTSGTLTFKRNPKNIDVFLVGGGAGGGSAVLAEQQDDDYETSYNTTTIASGGGPGGGGGYTKTQKNVAVSSGIEYSIVVGSGGTSAKLTNGMYVEWNSSGKRMHFIKGGDGGTSSAFGYSAAGGSAGDAALDNYSYGGSGGSGGGGMVIPRRDYLAQPQPLTGGQDGGDSQHTGEGTASVITTCAGKGQGTTTREFGEISAQLYAGGGGSGNDYHGRAYYTSAAPGGAGGGGAGGYKSNGAAGSANTGGGGGGAGVNPDMNWSNTYGKSSGAGGSGIVIIRNAR